MSWIDDKSQRKAKTFQIECCYSRSVIQWLAAILKDDDIGAALEGALAKVTNTYFVSARR